LGEARYGYLCVRGTNLELASRRADGGMDLFWARSSADERSDRHDQDSCTVLVLPRRLRASLVLGTQKIRRSGVPQEATHFREVSQGELKVLGLFERAETPDLSASCYEPRSAAGVKRVKA
jgi:hypothetical protein